MNKIICLTPIKNEDWILGTFLESTSNWADKIILADQNSTDESVNISKSFKKVKLINNNFNAFNEHHRQNLLISEARKNGINNILIALDADELLSPNYLFANDWKSLKSLEPGTTIMFRWMNICPDLKHYWSPDIWFPFGYIDDNKPHKGKDIHSPRIPMTSYSRVFFMQETRIMHLQYINWTRMKSKQRWYQCWEKINHPNRRCTSIYRQYHHMDVIGANDLKILPHSHISKLKKFHIEKISSTETQSVFYWDKQIIMYIQDMPKKYFQFVDIWTMDFSLIINQMSLKNEQSVLKKIQPLSPCQSLFFLYMKATQKYAYNPIIKIVDFVVDLIIKLC